MAFSCEELAQDVFVQLLATNECNFCVFTRNLIRCSLHNYVPPDLESVLSARLYPVKFTDVVYAYSPYHVSHKPSILSEVYSNFLQKYISIRSLNIDSNYFNNFNLKNISWDNYIDIYIYNIIICFTRGAIPE